MNKKQEEIRRILAQNIKKRREILGFSQEQLAETTNLSVQTINTIEGCRTWVSDKTLSQLAQALKIEVFQLFVPYNANKVEKDISTSSILLELRQKIIDDIYNVNTHIDSRFNEALKNQSQQNYEKKSIQNPSRIKKNELKNRRKKHPS